MSTTSYVVDYIESQLLKGVEKEQIIKSLLENKWKKEDIDIAFLELDKKLSNDEKINKKDISPEVIASPYVSNIKPSLESKFSYQPGEKLHQIKKEDSPQNMPRVLSIASDAFSLYKENFLTLVTISLISQIILGLIGYCLETSFYKNLLENGQIDKTYIIIATSIFLALIYLWINGATISSIIERSGDNQEIGITGFFLIAKSRLPSLLWISFLFIFINISISAIIASALIVLILFSEEWINLVYIISLLSIIFLATLSVIWYILAAFFLFDRNELGINALIKAREYIKGRWWAVVYRFIFSGLFFIAIFLLLFFIALLIPDNAQIKLSQINLGSNIIRIVMVFFAPLIWSYLFFIYQNLKDSKNEDIEESSDQYVNYLIFICSLGAIIIITSIIWIIISGGFSSAGFELIKGQVVKRIMNSEPIKLVKIFFDF